MSMILSGRRSPWSGARQAPALTFVLLAACTSTPVARPPAPTPLITRTPTATSTPSQPPDASFSAARALATVRTLAEFGPREAVSPAYRRAADSVRRKLASLGYQVRLQRVSAPAGTVDGLRVRAGTTYNVVAEPPGFDSKRPFVVVGAISTPFRIPPVRTTTRAASPC